MNKPKPIKSQPVVPSLELLEDGRVDRVFEITGTDMHIGRTRGSEIQIDDTKVSRNHARVERRSDGSCLLVDLDSQNHTYVDDRKLTPFEPVRLRDGCRIKIFDHELIFRDPTVGLRKDAEERSTVVGSIEDLSSVRLARRLAQPAEALQAILDVNRALGGTDLNEIFGRVLDGLMAIFPRADGGFILTAEEDGTLPLRAVRHRGGADQAPSLSRTIARHVLDDGKAVLISDASLDSDYRTQESVASSLRSALVVPLPGSGGKPVGMVQLASRTSSEGFKGPDLDLLAALAVPMGIAVENHSLLKKRAAWGAAGDIQRALLPRERPDSTGYAFWECYRPAEEVGGDLYDYIPVGSAALKDGDSMRWAVALGDVSGKGMPAALDDGRNLSRAATSRARGSGARRGLDEGRPPGVGFRVRLPVRHHDPHGARRAKPSLDRGQRGSSVPPGAPLWRQDRSHRPRLLRHAAGCGRRRRLSLDCSVAGTRRCRCPLLRRSAGCAGPAG